MGSSILDSDMMENEFMRLKAQCQGFIEKSRTARVPGATHVRKSDYSGTDQLIPTFNFSLFNQRLIRVKDFDLHDGYKQRTFYSYLLHAAKMFGPKGYRILRQAKGFKKFMLQRIDQTSEVHSSSSIDYQQ